MDEQQIPEVISTVAEAIATDEAEQAVATPPKKPRGRPKGSKNKHKHKRKITASDVAATVAHIPEQPQPAEPVQEEVIGDGSSKAIV